MLTNPTVEKLRELRLSVMADEFAKQLGDRSMLELPFEDRFGLINVILLGATGSGKTYIANALGMTASREFFTVKYTRLPDLLGELAIARAEGKYRNVMKFYKQVELLILDEWLLYPLREPEARDLLEVAEARYKRGSTIFCSQFDVGGWHEKIGDASLADAVCDRIVHDSYKIVVSGCDSMRKRKGLHEPTEE